MSSHEGSGSVYDIHIHPFCRVAGSEGSVDSSQVSSIMKAIGQNPSEAEIQVNSCTETS